MSANTISSRSWRDKYRLASLDKLLRKALVAEQICQVDTSDGLRIQNPYGSQPTVTVQALAGTYSIAAFTLTDDALTVTDEFIVAEQVYDFEQVMTFADLYANRIDEQNYAIATKVDQYVLNSLVLGAGATYSTPVSGFSASNTAVTVSNLAALVAGYADTYKGLYLVIENTDIPGFTQAQVSQGFSYSDMALNNGFMNSYMGVDIYVVRSGTFITGTVGTKTFANSGHRLFGVKKTATYAQPRGIRVMEKEVSGKTGQEIATACYVGAKVWATKAALTVDITLN